MVMKVDGLNNVYFKSNFKNSDLNVSMQKNENNKKINQISNITPDFFVKKPMPYTNLGITKLKNGLEVYSYKLANGYRVTIVPMENSPAVVKNYVNVGSMNETENIKGISHFLEHMAFNGTNGENGHLKLEVGDSFKKIDELGGWTNASTNYAITDYVNSTPQLNNNDLEKQIRIIAAMTEDLKLSKDMIEKEKMPVCSEINMILDDPQTIAFDQTVRTLFGIKNSADEMVGGSVKHVKNFNQKDLQDYYNKYYTPDNMNLVITGDVNPNEVINIVAKNFNSKKISQGKKFEEKLVPINKTVRKDFYSDKANSTEIVLGFAGPRNNDIKENVAFDLARTYLNSSLSGLDTNLKKYNTNSYVFSEKISTNPNSPQLVYLTSNVSDKNSENVLRTIFTSIANLNNIDDNDLKTLKQKLLMSRANYMESSANVNDSVGRAILDDSLEYFTNYEDYLNKITKDDVNNALKTYFDLNKTAVTLIHPLKDNISFKGKERLPLNSQNISQYRLKNNYEVGFYKTKNSNFQYNLNLKVDNIYNKKAGVIELLDEIYSMGLKNLNEDAWNRFQDENNFNIYASVSRSGLTINADSSFENRNFIYKGLKELLYSPNISQENLDIAKERVKDRILNRQDSAYRLYSNFEASKNIFENTEQEILDNLDNITLEEIKDCHKYFIENSRGIVTANLPLNNETTVKNEVIKNLSNFTKVLPNKKNEQSIFVENKNTEVLQKETNNSQADILQVFKFKADNSLKENALAEITNSILNNSSIGLFNNLREKEHLAYSVNSSITKSNDRGELSCHILTTTDNKNIGEISYDNVKKSIDGFNKQITELKLGNFTDLDLNNAKLLLKADLLDQEYTHDKLNALAKGLNSNYGITYINKLYKEIDKITRQDVINFAQKVFENKPIYAITATKDTLEFNKEYLENLTV